ncbi:MAG: hypothetical protein A2Y45_07435 [Tenericutes bacterium GWC2_34_14]|nr:MAG: hypothetical protein A2Z84_02730 [Tenericutes bacterium GWA2_35_7]OHE29739.1 MAG: hypothetical protein A2Y45_07435 [Tenericutes bacterium GWC2_34_14]OHE34718.1 MAG: hypothetical protein A2012_01045 [Tenericutes bacterium GWE2_34_108]OHE37421.1 MAG: hypothetical protein A2Y46_01965 [Tenericutes bacterium GWF1_35_14]OHE39445.1 MAG: hypothetical protein A2Y44_00895 [Tenericutes bacterium GWF2_35_184]OHE44366.1 MAG: hypothetical protein A2221_04615 [Tenericutes bacterium RIFOXYA2_FULL_36_3
MIEYLTNHREGTIIYQTDGFYISKYSLLYTIEHLCMEYLFTYSGYRKAVKHVFNFTHLVPIYLDEDLQFIAVKRVRDYDNIFINIKSIDHIEQQKDMLQITFTSGRKLYIKMSLYRYNKLIENLSIIRNTKVKHFH